VRTKAGTKTYTREAFGSVRARTGTSKQPYQHLGNAYDADSKLSDFRARAYDPVAGRFTSEDPVAGLAAIPQSLDPYAYGWNGPLTHPDPNGDYPICLPLLPVAAEAALVVGEDAAFNAAPSGADYLTHASDKGAWTRRTSRAPSGTKRWTRPSRTSSAPGTSPSGYYLMRPEANVGLAARNRLSEAWRWLSTR